ncbi:MAG: ATP-dependent RecD-like DNA helicase [Clostridia bacterium]|nr:ATP-dependent RecD-like DNA helicase [Clostridia bacterium]
MNTEELCGSVERIVFQKDNSDWTVIEVETAAGIVKVTGELPSIAVGETVRLKGAWVEHPSFGRQFRAVTCERYAPDTTDALYRYLASGAIKGIGPALATEIVRKFGDETMQILENKPLRLAEIKGISEKKALQCGQEFATQAGLREILLAFSLYGLTPTEATRAYKKWGLETVKVVKANPYELCTNGLRIDFDRADAIAQGCEVSLDDPRRIAAGILHVLRHNVGNGHTCLPQSKLVERTAAFLTIPSQEPILKELYELELSLEVRHQETEKDTFWFLTPFFRAESYIASRMKLLISRGEAGRTDVEERIAALQKNKGIVYEERQKQAIVAAVNGASLILTGGPGTGKTTTLNGILALLESYGERVLLAAPTGRAAKRMTELTGRDAKTIHRLLEVQWGENDELVFARNEKNPLDADTVVIDEVSMVDVLLFETLLRALPGNCRLVLVGDCDQLPAVGAGRVLGDLIDSEALPTVQLTQVFRQSMESHIVESAHRVVAGKCPLTGYKEGDFFFLPRSTAFDTLQTVEDLCARRLPDRYGLSLLDGIQVLSPSRKGELGTISVNAALQAQINPPGPKKREIKIENAVLRQGDKVMHTRNNYDLAWKRDDGEAGTGVFNGDIGVLESLDEHGELLVVRYDDHTVTYTREDAKDLELAYAVTVHKSQGNEFEAVVLPLFGFDRKLWYRNLLYTAITRAKSLLVIVGDPYLMQEMVRNQNKSKRYTGLLRMLQEEEGL